MSNIRARSARPSAVSAVVAASLLLAAPTAAVTAPAAGAVELTGVLGSAQVASANAGSSGTAAVVGRDDVDPFYDTSTVSPATPGEILRAQQAPYSPMVDGPDLTVPTTAEKIMYTTEDMHGAPTAVTGYVVEPTVPWDGPGERPTVVIGRGTVGQGDQCAPSRNWPLDNQPDPIASGRMVALEGLYDWVFASAGVRVVVTDYIGMGTPGMHTYMNRLEQGHAMIDAARAARNVVEGNGGTFGQVGFYGHSQGGGASAAAVELAGDYAPDVSVAGAYSSAPPADLGVVQRHIDGSGLMGAIGLAINGLGARYPELQSEIDAEVNDAGRAALTDISGMCTDEIEENYGGMTTAAWTTSGARLDAILDELPAGREAMEAQRIGTGRNTAPTMIVAGPHDPTVDYQQSKDLAGQWCAHGGDVVYRDDVLPQIGDYNHFAQAVSGLPFGMPFLLDRFRGVPVVGGCVSRNPAPAPFGL